MNNKETAQQIKALGDKLLKESQEIKALCNTLDKETRTRTLDPSYKLIKAVLSYTKDIEAVLLDNELLELKL